MKSKVDYILKNLDVFFPNPKCPLNYEKDYELLLAVMLSAQTTDERVNMVTKELFKYTLEELASMDSEKIESIIKPVGTQKRKAEYIKKISRKLLDDRNGQVPYDREYIESLPGVGHKTCNVVFSELSYEPTLAVDTHVTRVSKRLGIAEELDSVEIIEEKLCKFFPMDVWAKVHIQLVLFGRYKCKAKNPLCEECPFKDICSAYKKTQD